MSKDNKLTSPKRERVSINFLGVDNSSPDISVKDGAMAEMYNVRYNDDAWRPVHMFDKVGDIPDGYRVVYHHPAAGEKVYIITDGYDDFYSYDLETKDRSLIASFVEHPTTIKHFGNVLIFIFLNEVRYYIFDSSYSEFTFPPYVRTERLSGGMAGVYPTYVQIPDENGADYDYKWLKWEDFKQKYKGNTDLDFMFKSRIAVAWELYDFADGGIDKMYVGDEYSETFNGEFLFFTTWRMKDGTILSPSPLHLMCPQGIESYDSERISRKVSFTDDPYDFQNAPTDESVQNRRPSLFAIQRVKDKYISSLKDGASSDFLGPDFSDNNLHVWNRPVVSLRHHKDLVLHPEIVSVAVWATKPQLLFETDREKMNYGIGDGTFSWAYADNELAKQPFYLVDEIDVKDFVQEKIWSDDAQRYEDTDFKKYDFTFTRTLMNRSLHNDRYVPINNIHKHIPNAVLDYNSQLHIADVKTILADTYNIAEDWNGTASSSRATQYVEVDIDNKVYTVVNGIAKNLDSTQSVNVGSPFSQIISYPDFRAKRHFAYFNGLLRVDLTSAEANNWAFYHSMPTEELKYPYINYESQADIEFLPADNRTYNSLNKLFVSKTNNPFAFDFTNTYSFGLADNKVLAIQSAAVEMSDAKYGEFPLFVFTHDGIYTLQVGSETVYSNHSPLINADRIINPRTLAINYNVVYITKKGIHLLNSEGSTLISQPIDTMLGYPDVDKFQRLYPLRSTQYNEIAFVVDGIAYVYSLINGVWSTRSFDMYPISQEEAYRNNEVFNIMNENTAPPAGCVIASRPIKLGSVEYKRLETFIPRFANLAETENMSITITIEGSNDCKEWKELRKVDAQGYTVIRRTPQSCKYFRFILEFIDVEEFTFSNVDLEYYVKFLRRMR